MLLKAAYECTRAKAGQEDTAPSDDTLTQIRQQLGQLSDEMAQLREKVEGKSAKNRKGKVTAVK